MREPLTQSINFNTIQRDKGICMSLSSDEKMTSLAISVNQLREEMREYMKAKLTEDSIPETIVEEVVSNRLAKKERLNRPLLEGEIKEALTKYREMYYVAEYLGVDHKTLKKYMDMYGLTAAYWRPTRGAGAKKIIEGGYYCSASMDRGSHIDKENILFGNITTSESGFSFFTSIK